MDKQSLISSIAQSQEDTLLLAKIYDKLSAGERRNIPAFTSFLTGRELLMAQTLTHRAGLPDVHAFGGVPGAERQVLGYIPDYYDPEEFLMGDEGPIAALRAHISAYDHLEHRDFLGGILAQGIRREVLGDIFVGEDACDFLVLREQPPQRRKDGRCTARKQPLRQPPENLRKAQINDAQHRCAHAVHIEQVPVWLVVGYKPL